MSLWIIDFETYWDKQYSLSKIGAVAYTRDKRFDCYLLSVVKNGERVFLGHPRDFDFSLLVDQVVGAHNMTFDGAVWRRLYELGIAKVDRTAAKELFCTADLAVFFQAPRDLKGASRELLGLAVSKEYRKKTIGKSGAELAMDAETLEAGTADAFAAYKLAEKYLPLWPEAEREISRLNREAGWYGVAIDKKKVDDAVESLEAQLHHHLKYMVWADDADDTPLSVIKIREHGRKQGIPTPASFDSDDPAVEKWYEDYKHIPWVIACRDYRRVNTFYKKILVLKNEAWQDTDGNWVYSYQKKYFGAATGRFSGAGGFNMENMPKKEMFGIDIRSCFIARRGKRFLLGDYAQIEARLLLWAAGDLEFVKLIEELKNLYVAYLVKRGKAEKTATKKTIGSDRYSATKAEVLGLGYGMGAKKYVVTALADYGVDMTLDEATVAVQEYREANQLVCARWRYHDKFLHYSASQGDPTHEIMLKSGRVLVYHNPISVQGKWPDGTPKREVKVQPERGGTHLGTYGGKLTENEIQATARDVLRDAWIKIHNELSHIVRILFSVHDEFIMEIDEELCTDETRHEVRNRMITASPWAQGAPIDVDLGDMEYVSHYKK